MHPKNISIADFSYTLPPERIAHYPLSERAASKLLIYQDGAVHEDVYQHIHRYLPENSLLVFNNTKVVEARIVFQKPSGAEIEIFCLEPAPEYPDIPAALSQTGKVRWKCLVGGASKWKPGQVLTRRIEEQPAGEPSGLDGSGPRYPLVLEARWVGKLDGAFLIELSWSSPALNFAGLLHLAGLVPLPPYIRRDTETSDSERYQTVYARYDGSVAAPTAGLHFTEAVFQTLEAKHIDRVFVTLHVGAGTFMPVKSDTLEQHTMHAEFIEVDRSAIGKLLAFLGKKSSGQHIVPVGTTSLRTIESLYWLGVKTIRDPAILPEDLVVYQWDAFAPGDKNDPALTDAGSGIGPGQALRSLLNWMEHRGLDRLLTKTQLLITPGYEWKLTTGLITNFHQPGSTLLLLVAALIGEDWNNVYQYALEHEFRFLSYGDGCLLFPRSRT
jgi:S-adenosylmethionine:tRNA ribosyltransferase-isomerase